MLNDMNCNKIDAALLQDYLEGTIDPVEKIFVEGHLSICKSCRRQLSELKLIFWELGDKSSYEVEYPRELNEISSKLIDRVLGTEEKSTTRKVVDMQISSLKMSQKLLKYIPGAKKTPGILKKASRGLAKGVTKSVTKGVKKMLSAK
ncbi:MAG: hypothetical protein K0R50_1834 [Eubacterium sp.]|jgi:predicted anti-sigma-YlaC factor YlaD|nr:hypothetical protein [Eubacterium sp.]